jgi:hypothetical protein
MQIPVTADMCPFSWNIYAEEGVLHVLWLVVVLQQLCAPILHPNLLISLTN